MQSAFESALSPIQGLFGATSVVPRLHWRRDPADLQQVLLLIAELDHMLRTSSFRGEL